MHLKKARRKGDRVYLSIAENYREGNKTRMRHIESIGYVDELQSPTCPDPIAFWQAEVDRRNAEAKAQAAPVMVKLSSARKIDKKEDRRIDLGAAVPSPTFTATSGYGRSSKRRGQRVRVLSILAGYWNCSYGTA